MKGTADSRNDFAPRSAGSHEVIRHSASRGARRLRLWVAGWMFLFGLAPAIAIEPGADALRDWRAQFAREVDHRLDVPLAAQQQYVLLLRQALTEANLSDSTEQAFLLVDRSEQVQAAFIVLRSSADGWFWVGATAVSTGKTGSFEHFLTPLGVFAHSLDNPDFRAEGTFNEKHIRGYGTRGLRVFDFGWQSAERGWGAGGTSQMRLQMHATDPQVLEPRLGRVASKGCIRIPATLNVFLDRYGILDADYEQAQAGGTVQWVLKRDREPIAWPGRYMVIVDSKATHRPPWSPLPRSTSSLDIAPEEVAVRQE